MKVLGSIATAMTFAATLQAQTDLSLTSTPFIIGQDTELTIQGPSDSWVTLMFDDQPGNLTLPGGAWFGLGISGSFSFLLFDTLNGAGEMTVTMPVPNAPGLLGSQFYLQSASIGERTALALTSNRLDVTVRAEVNGELASSVSEFGITWTFDKEYEVGQFANGDWWVVGPVNIVQINPPSVEINGRIKNGSMINPSPEDGLTQGYDSHMYDFGDRGKDYQAAMNVAFEVSPSQPLHVAPHSSLVSTISVDEIARPQIKTCAILTVLSESPPDGSFRPAYCGSDKTVAFQLDQVDTSLLQSLAPVGATPEIDEVAQWFDRPWLDHMQASGGFARFIHPKDNMPDYSREMATQVGEGALMLHVDVPLAEKMDLLINMIQLGIDLYGITQDGGHELWPGHAGQCNGRKWPVLFAGIMLNDPAMSRVGFDKSIMFGEDGQTFFVQETSVGVVNFGYGGYAASDIGLAEWGTAHASEPAKDSADWYGNGYRLCCTANSWNGYALAALIMDAKDDWNHDAFFEYMDRYIETTRANGDDAPWVSWSEFTIQMWDRYRPDYE